jgi:ATP-dependent protease ClpP protease subunit
MDRDRFMSADEAVAYGIIDRVIERRPSDGKPEDGRKPA